MTVKFSTIDNGAREREQVPYINSTVDGVRVRFIDRADEDFVGWRCDEHGDATCSHAREAMTHLSRRITDRMREFL